MDLRGIIETDLRNRFYIYIVYFTQLHCQLQPPASKNIFFDYFLNNPFHGVWDSAIMQ